MTNAHRDDDVLELTIVIPAYNEAEGIQQTLQIVTAYLGSQRYESEVIVVDDGSTDDTVGIVAEYVATRSPVRLIRNGRNLGKGASVKRGVLEARGRYVFFMDADLAVPIEELTGAFAAIAGGAEPILIGSRRFRGARIERRQPRLREYLGSGFTLLARLLLWPEILDFTCGFKGFRREDARALFALQQCNDWAFDAEILYLARLTDRRVRQYPVRWMHQRNSRVRFPRDIYRTLVALMRIRWRAGRTLQNGANAPAVLGHAGAARIDGPRD